MIPNSKPIELKGDRTNDKNHKKKNEFNEQSYPKDFFIQLKSRFSDELTHCKYIIHHLFGFCSLIKLIILITVTILQLKEPLIIFYK